MHFPIIRSDTGDSKCCEALTMDNGKAKKKTQMKDGPVRIDHSEVYFENDRLTEELGIVKDILMKYKHRQYLSRDIEIKELRRNLVSLEALKNTSHHTQLQKRPQTTPAYMTRHESIASQPRVIKLNVRIPDDDDSSQCSSDPDSDVVVKPAPILKARRPMAPLTMTKGAVMKAHLEHRKFPKSWYTDVLQPCDAEVPKALFSKSDFDSNIGRSKSAGYGKRARRKQSLSVMDRRSGIPEIANDRPTLVCSRSKSAVLSRRKLMQMTNLDHVLEPEEKIEPVKALREINRIQNERLQVRIKMFLDSLDDVKKRREAARQTRKARRMTAVFGSDSGWFNDAMDPPW